jgi:putative ABC transport system permease protein
MLTVRFGIRNLLQDRVRLGVAVLACAFACFLMTFQGSLLSGFTRSASAVINAVDADIWITVPGVTCFDFGAPISTRYAQMIAAAPHVVETARICTQTAHYKTQAGEAQTVILIGSEQSSKLPAANAAEIGPESLVVNESNARMLGAIALPAEVEINNRRGRVVSYASGFETFLGCPYVFTSYRAALKFLDMPKDYATFILAKIEPGADASEVRNDIRRLAPEVSAWTKTEFASKSQQFWLVRTGSGGAILMGALLAFLIGLAVVSQAIYASTIERIEEFATLKALGATNNFVSLIVIVQVLSCAVLGAALGIPSAILVVSVARRTIEWIYMPWSLPLFVILPTLGMCLLAGLFAVRTALRADPAMVFRA